MRLALSIAGAALGLLVAGCAGVRSGNLRESNATSLTWHARAAPAIDERFEASFDLLRAAIEDNDDEIARQIAAGILARGPDNATRAVALRWVDVLDGRAVMAACHFELRVAVDPDLAGSSIVELVTSTDLRSPARLEIAPFLVTRQIVALDRLGAERVGTTSELWDGGARLALPMAGEEQRVVVARGKLQSNAAIALRDSWRLDVRSGHVWFEGRRLPVHGFALEAPLKEWLASFLDLGATEPAEFGRFVCDPASFELDEEVFTARLLERMLRVPLSRRDELVPVLMERARSLDDDRFVRLLPAVRWLSGTGGQGADPTVLRKVLADLDGRGDGSAGRLDTELVLPATRR